MRFRFDIVGIDCPHCASKLESMMKKEFIDANINFATSGLIIDADDTLDEDSVLEKAQSIASEFEDGITVSFRD